MLGRVPIPFANQLVAAIGDRVDESLDVLAGGSTLKARRGRDRVDEFLKVLLTLLLGFRPLSSTALLLPFRRDCGQKPQLLRVDRPVESAVAAVHECLVV